MLRWGPRLAPEESGRTDYSLYNACLALSRDAFDYVIRNLPPLLDTNFKEVRIFDQEAYPFDAQPVFSSIDTILSQKIEEEERDVAMNNLRRIPVRFLSAKKAYFPPHQDYELFTSILRELKDMQVPYFCYTSAELDEKLEADAAQSGMFILATYLE